MHDDRPVAAHLMRIYLGGTTTFIYQYLINIQQYRSIVLAVTKERPEQFPFPDVYTPPLSKLHLLLTRTDRRFFHRQRLAEPYFKQVIQSQKAKLLHAHFGYTGVFSLPLSLSTGLPLITTFYGFDVSAMPRKIGWLKSYEKLFKHGALFLAEGSYLKEQLIALGCPREKVLIQRIGIDLERFSFREAPPVSEGVRILMCGRFMEKKGFEYGIRAFARILPDFPNSQLRIIGDGPLKANLEREIHRLGPEAERRVVMLGKLSYDAYTEEALHAHIFMAPSVTATDGDTEGGAPTVLLEMQARGIPVLSTWHADIPEVVVDGASGYLAPERDSSALSEKLAELLAQPDQWSVMGRAGREHIENQHDIVKLAGQLEEKYDAVLSSAEL